MKHAFLGRILGIAATASLIAGCTMKTTEEPALSGPSEFSTSISLGASPDVLTEDGASQSVITITARDANNQPIRNLSLRAEIQVGGIRTDFGTISARNVATGNDGKASLVYTAPAAPSIASDEGLYVQIAVTPIGTDASNAVPRSVSIRLVPPGIVVPPDGLTPSFTFTPSAPVESQTVLFDATASTAGPGNAIVGYSWNFGDGARGSGATASHAYTTADTYVVTLTVTDAVGRTAQKTASITVQGGVSPTAAFSSSPTDPVPNQSVNFNASASKAAPGRTITGYSWDFGDGTFGSGVTTSHSYALSRSYVVVLTVTDDTGKKGTATGTVTVQ
jgi:PKD repeat protein